MPCAVCGGRVIKTDSGKRCMNSACAGSSAVAQGHQEVINCSCGESMSYKGLTQLGEPLYKCMACGKTTKL